MTDGLDDAIFDDLFHGCAWLAFITLLHEQGAAPDSETTRRRAYALYEEELRRVNANKPPAT